MVTAIKLNGTQSILQSDEIAQMLRDSIAKDPDLIIDCSAVEEVDLTFIQLMMSAHKSCQIKGGRLRLSSRADGLLLAALDRMGLRPGGSQNFWFEGVGP